MNSLKVITQRKAIFAKVRKAPQNGDYVWDGKDEDERPYDPGRNAKRR